MALVLAGRDADVGVARFARPVHHAPHDRHLEGDLLVAERVLRPAGDVDDVDLGPAARRAGDEVDVLALAQAHRLEQRPARPRFLHRVGGEAVADRVADALGQQRGDAGRRLDDAAGQRTGLGDTEVQRMVDGVGELPVGLDHQRHRRGLDRDLDVLEPDLVEVGQLHLRRLDHRLGGDLAAVLLVQVGVQRPAVHADADGHAPVLGLLRHQLDVLGPADVARVEPQAVDPGLERGERHAVLVVDVGHDGHRRPGHDAGQALGRLGLVARAPHDVAAGHGQVVDLLQRAVDVGRLGGRHRLHRDGSVTADGHVAHHDLAGLATRVRGFAEFHQWVVVVVTRARSG